VEANKRHLSDADYLASFVEYDTNGGCWLWRGGLKAPDSYGNQSRTHLPVKAHRASYVVHVGPIPEGENVLHRCDVPCCVNPSHLFLGSQQDNVSDMMRKGRHRVAYSRTDRHGAPRNVPDPQLTINRQLWAEGPAKRADANLRSFCRREGAALFCAKCDGDGVVLAVVSLVLQPVKCTRCGGEGLEPLG